MNHETLFHVVELIVVLQLMDGMWRLLTNNVEVLPKLSLEQWEVLFCIIAAGSELTDFASFKAFEVNCVQYSLLLSTNLIGCCGFCLDHVVVASRTPSGRKYTSFFRHGITTSCKKCEMCCIC